MIKLELPVFSESGLSVLVKYLRVDHPVSDSKHRVRALHAKDHAGAVLICPVLRAENSDELVHAVKFDKDHVDCLVNDRVKL